MPPKKAATAVKTDAKKNAIEGSASSSTSSTQKKPGRGRPKKVQAVAEDEAASEDAEESLSDQVQVAVENVEDGLNVAKRGRQPEPTKPAAASAGDEKADTSVEESPPKRGRPPSKKSKLAVASANNEKADTAVEESPLKSDDKADISAEESPPKSDKKADMAVEELLPESDNKADISVEESPPKSDEKADADTAVEESPPKRGRPSTQKPEKSSDPASPPKNPTSGVSSIEQSVPSPAAASALAPAIAPTHEAEEAEEIDYSNSPPQGPEANDHYSPPQEQVQQLLQQTQPAQQPAQEQMQEQMQPTQQQLQQQLQQLQQQLQQMQQQQMQQMQMQQMQMQMQQQQEQKLQMQQQQEQKLKQLEQKQKLQEQKQQEQKQQEQKQQTFPPTASVSYKDEPVPYTAPFQQRTRGVCFQFQKGACNRGDQCIYEHKSTATSEKRDRICSFDFQNYGCARGEMCQYQHIKEQQHQQQQQQQQQQQRDFGSDTCWQFQRGECFRGDACKFSHGARESGYGQSDSSVNRDRGVYGNGLIDDQGRGGTREGGFEYRGGGGGGGAARPMPVSTHQVPVDNMRSAPTISPPSGNNDRDRFNRSDGRFDDRDNWRAAGAATSLPPLRSNSANGSYDDRSGGAGLGYGGNGYDDSHAYGGSARALQPPQPPQRSYDDRVPSPRGYDARERESERDRSGSGRELSPRGGNGYDVNQERMRESSGSVENGNRPLDHSPGTVVFVNNINLDADRNEARSFLLREFSRFGRGPIQVHVPLDRETGRHRGFAFLTFSDASQVQEVIRVANQTAYASKTLCASLGLGTRTQGAGAMSRGGGAYGGGGGHDQYQYP